MTRWGAALVVAVVLAAGCSSGDDAPDAHSTTSPRISATDALTTLLGDEQRGDHAGSFALLSKRSRATYRDVDDWKRLRSQLPAVTGFTVTAADRDSVVAVVQHEPGLDPFIGLSPARTRETWTARIEGGAWRFDAEPRVQPLLPDPMSATQAALDWATAVRSCDAPKAASLQAVTRVFGRSEGANELCGTAPTTSLRAEPVDLPTGPQTADLVAQYTSDALTWAQAVHIDGTDIPFSVVLAPIGDDWRVVAVFDGP